MALYRGPGQIPTLLGNPAQEISLPSGGTYTLSPAGWYQIRTGPYSCIQAYDPYTGSWRRVGGGASGTGGVGGTEFFYSDGVNYRLANQTGCPVGALINNAGTGYTGIPTFAANTGGSLWKAWVGGAVSATVTVSNGGSGYTYPPICVISPPPTITNGGGICATATCTLSSGALSTVTITNQGAGYTSAPMINFINDPRENPNIPITGTTVTQGSGAAAILTLTGAKTVTGLVCQDHGTGGQSAVVTLTPSGGAGASATALVIMCWTITATAVGTAGNIGSGSAVWITAEDNFYTSAAAYTNPDTQANLVTIRKADIRGVVTTNTLTGTPVVYDGGIYTTSPTVLVLANASVVTTAPVVTATLGGTTDTSYVMPW